MNVVFNYVFSLIKEETNRPKYRTLLQHIFIQNNEKVQQQMHQEVSSYVSEVLESMANNGITQFTADQPAVW